VAARDPNRSFDQPHPARFAASEPGYEVSMNAHREALERGEPGYVDPISGNFVFTAQYLAGRACCECGCRHCPYVGDA
jgi:hypothetical protein